MKTKVFYPFLFAFLAISLNLFAQEDAKTVSSKIAGVTVFLHGAELSHTANASLLKGENEIRIEGLSPVIDVNSLKIKATNGVVVSSYEFSIDYLSAGKALNTSLKIMEDSIKIYQEKLDKVGIDLKVNSNMISYLQSGITKNVSGSEAGLGIDELMKTMDYYKSKSEQLEMAQSNLNKEKTKLTNTVNRLQAQLNQERTKGSKTSGVLKLNLSAPRATASTFSITYYTHTANWTPFYEINIASTDKPIVIAQKSKVRQTSGLDWENVKLTLSTSSPSNGKTAPLFNAWFLREYQIPTPRYTSQNQVMQNAYSYDESSTDISKELAESVPGIKIRGAGSIQNSVEPIYIVDGVVLSQEEAAGIDPSMIKSMEVLKDASASAIYGARAAGGVVLINTKTSMDDFVRSSDNEVSIVYNIDLPYTIPGNGKEQNIDLGTKETNAEYKYYCAPKLDKETYLLAEIADWEKLKLLSGKANITYDGTYIGETFINAESTQAKLDLTLGADKRVSVKREKMQEFSNLKTLGSDVVQTFTYKLTVKNNQNKTVKMVLKDQYPISTQNKIEAKLLKETTAWTANKEDVGVITWEEDFAPGETKTYQISYSVKYPKGMKLNL